MTVIHSHVNWMYSTIDCTTKKGERREEAASMSITTQRINIYQHYNVE